METELEQFRKKRSEFLELRLNLVKDGPDTLSKIIYYNTNIAVAVFGGISIALAFLHGKELMPSLNITMSIFVSLVGVLIASMIINSVQNAKKSAMKSEVELKVILTMLDAKIITDNSMISINKDVNDNISKACQKHKELLLSNNESQLKTAGWLIIIIEVIRVFMVICLAYPLMALWFLICCPDVFKYIW